MLYAIFDYLNSMDIPGAGVFQFLTFRAAMAIICSLLISMVLGEKLIKLLRKKLIGETVRDLGLAGEKAKHGTPTMGGLIILASILIPTLLFAKLSNIYTILMLISTVLLGLIGFTDDYIKVFKKDKKGLAGKFKVIGQIVVGLIAGSILFFNPNTSVKQVVKSEAVITDNSDLNYKKRTKWEKTDEHITTIPFIKDNELNYKWLVTWISDDLEDYTWIVYILVVVVIVISVSNGANLTDGLDGLATGTSAIIGATLGVFAYVSGHQEFAEYLNIMFIPNSGELVVFIAAFVGACIGFLWYNSYPAQVFMGDTGSLAIGGIIAVFALAIRKELLIPILCGIFLVENLSVVLQVSWFKYTKKKYGEGRRIFLMSPLHHHYQKIGWHESKIVSRFWIIGIMLAVLTIVTLKIR